MVEVMVEVMVAVMVMVMVMVMTRRAGRSTRAGPGRLRAGPCVGVWRRRGGGGDGGGAGGRWHGPTLQVEVACACRLFAREGAY